ncbi:MAG: hypothetical protein M3179_06010, partial [Actinomycetota bacterium]|nr:hypothetical protein [Actinomycetota bacterium]
PRLATGAGVVGDRAPVMRQLLTEIPDDGDEVARQRRKRAAAFLDRPVAGFDDVTLEDVLRSVIAATDECDGPLDIDDFLAERGHAWQTVEMVQVCLTIVDRHISSPPPAPW